MCPTGLGQLLVWEWQSESYVLKQQGHFNSMVSLAYSPDGQYIVTGGDDGKVGLGSGWGTWSAWEELWGPGLSCWLGHWGPCQALLWGRLELTGAPRLVWAKERRFTYFPGSEGEGLGVPVCGSGCPGHAAAWLRGLPLPSDAGGCLLHLLG